MADGNLVSWMTYRQLGTADSMKALVPGNIAVDGEPIFRERVGLSQSPQIMGELLSLPGHARPFVQIGKGPAPAIPPIAGLFPDDPVEPSLKATCQIEIAAINRQNAAVQDGAIKPLREGDGNTQWLSEGVLCPRHLFDH